MSTFQPGQQTLSGKVVDANNKPIAGIRITLRSVSGARIPSHFYIGDRLKSTSARSGPDGGFKLTNLPDEPIELSFSRPGAYGYPIGKAGKSVLYPGRLRPELNQTDIRVLFDPTLTTPPIDLH